jgi:hypothetical protein
MRRTWLESATTHGRSAPDSPKLIVGLVSAAIALGCAGVMSAAAEGAIAPGKAVAGVSLGDTAAQVEAVLGKPERGSNSLSYRYINRHGLGVYFIAGTVFEITVLRGRQATAKGIKVGSTKAQVTDAYPKATCRKAVVGRSAFECLLKARFKGRATETVFTTRRDKVVSIAVHFA